ncbi:MAG TPA: ankyrin repeat domain-containing protein, partial [Candidatus Babeliales bacterium]|nr:ankyrin repeat domain-containing protein [Candidatus Babeliales bacterium]
DEAKERLQMFLSNIVVFGREDDGVYINGFIFPNEGLDIIKAGLDILGDPQNDLLIDAAQRNKIKTMKLLLDRGVDKEFKREFTEEYIDTSSGLETISTYTQRYTALYMAVRSNKQDAVDLLIQRGAHVNTTDAHGRTPLIMAAMRGHVEIVKKLFAAGAITWLIDAFDKGALDYAQEKLAKQKLDENKEKYEKIIQLLQDVDAKK